MQFSSPGIDNLKNILKSFWAILKFHFHWLRLKSQPVWPDLAKIRNFDKIFKVLGLFTIWLNFENTLANLRIPLDNFLLVSKA